MTVFFSTGICSNILSHISEKLGNQKWQTLVRDRWKALYFFTGDFTDVPSVTLLEKLVPEHCLGTKHLDRTNLLKPKIKHQIKQFFYEKFWLFQCKLGLITVCILESFMYDWHASFSCHSSSSYWALPQVHLVELVLLFFHV